MRVVGLIRDRAARRIQRKVRGRTAIAVAKVELQVKKEKKIVEIRRVQAQGTRVVDCQRVVRGFLARRGVAKRRQIVFIRLLLQRHKRLGIADVAIGNYRRRKERLVKVNAKATIIQALVRKFLARCWFLKRYKRLMRDRVAREKKRRETAATKIQSIVRRKLARKLVAKRRKDIAEERRLKGALDELEMRLEELHSEWLQGTCGVV